MSKQLTISAGFSIFATAALALFAATGGPDMPVHKMTSAPIAIEALADLVQLPKLSLLSN